MAQSASMVPPAAVVLPPKRTGRPLALNAELQARICDVIRAGNPISDAAQACGVPIDTHRKWITRGRNGEEPFCAYWQALQSALAETRMMLRGELLEAARADHKNWKAAEAVLSRLEPKPAPTNAIAAGFKVPPLDDEAYWSQLEELCAERRRLLAEKERDQKALLASASADCGAGIR